jgi:hypothetical protein
LAGPALDDRASPGGWANDRLAGAPRDSNPSTREVDVKSLAWRAAVAAASIAALGCGTNPVPSGGPTAGLAARACNAEVPAADVSAWHSVEAEGFTFCVPPDWSASGRSWSRGTARITWGLGSTVASADLPAIAQATTRPAFSCTSAATKHVQIHPTAEVIGGREARVWRDHVRQGFYTGGHWSEPHFYIVGEASDAASADLEMVILRTARVASR